MADGNAVNETKEGRFRSCGAAGSPAARPGRSALDGSRAGVRYPEPGVRCANGCGRTCGASGGPHGRRFRRPPRGGSAPGRRPARGPHRARVEHGACTAGQCLQGRDPVRLHRRTGRCAACIHTRTAYVSSWPTTTRCTARASPGRWRRAG
ncbi:hypothetical protein EBF04_28995 [Streptomyces sp. I6]|nr:hypothetical protein EBF04_28995 [Streptomyces sp. I6]